MTIFEWLHNPYWDPIHYWPKWLPTTFLIGFAVVIFVTEYYVLLPNIFEAYQTHLQRERELVNQLRHDWSELVNVKILKQQLDTLKKNVHERLKYLPSQEKSSPFLRYLSTHKTNLKLRYYHPAPVTRHKFYSEQLIRLSLVGSCPELIDFLISMKQPRNQITMKDLKLSLLKDDSKDQVVLRLNISAYVHYRD